MSNKNLFHITVGSVPEKGVELAEAFDHDIRLVKAALLYADQVTLCSPAAYFSSMLLATQRFTPKKKLEIVEELLPKLISSKPPSEQEKMRQAIQVLKILQTKKHIPSQYLRTKLTFERMFDDTWKKLKSPLKNTQMFSM